MVRLLKQLIKFTLSGTIAFVIDFGCYTLLTRVFGLMDFYIIVSICTSFLAILAGYFLNHYWTFKQTVPASLHFMRKYFMVTVSGLLIQNTLLTLFVEYIQIYDLVAKLTAVVIVGFGWNFMLSKFWVFKNWQDNDVVSV